MKSNTTLSDRRYKNFLMSFNFYYQYSPPALAFIIGAENKNGGEGIAEQVIERRIQEIKDSADIDLNDKEQEIAKLSKRLRKYIEYRIDHFKRDETNDSEPNSKWGKSTPAFGSNQSRKNVSEVPDKKNGREPAVKLESPTHDEPFVKVRHLFIDRLSTSSCHKNHTSTLMYLLKHKSFEDKVDKHDTWTNWYLEKNLIVASVSQSKMVRDLGIDRSTVKRHIQKLVENGDIVVEVENRENVYILGYVDAKGKEQFYHSGHNGDN